MFIDTYSVLIYYLVNQYDSVRPTFPIVSMLTGEKQELRGHVGMEDVA